MCGWDDSLNINWSQNISAITAVKDGTHILLSAHVFLTFKGRTFETAVAQADRSLFKCPLLLCQFLLERFH
jgi:hypothetical protein